MCEAYVRALACLLRTNKWEFIDVDVFGYQYLCEYACLRAYMFRVSCVFQYGALLFFCRRSVCRWPPPIVSTNPDTCVRA